MHEPTLKLPDAPWMPASVVARLASLLRDSDTYLEYGVGGSTLLAARSGPGTLIGVESDGRFLAAVGDAIERASEKIIWHPVYVDLGPTTYLGFPKTLRMRGQWCSYPLAPWQLGLSPDLVLIDGRFRLACAIATAAHAAPGTLVVFDDYLTRPWYWRATNYLDLVEKVGRAAIFRVRATRDPGLSDAIKSAARNPL